MQSYALPLHASNSQVEQPNSNARDDFDEPQTFEGGYVSYVEENNRASLKLLGQINFFMRMLWSQNQNVDDMSVEKDKNRVEAHNEEQNGRGS